MLASVSIALVGYVPALSHQPLRAPALVQHPAVMVQSSHDLDDPTPILSNFFSNLQRTPRFYTGLQNVLSGKTTTGMDHSYSQSKATDADECLLLAQMSAADLACTLIEAKGGQDAAAEVLRDAYRLTLKAKGSSNDMWAMDLPAQSETNDGPGPSYYTGM